MPEHPRHRRHHDDYDSDSEYDHSYSRGRDRARPRTQHRSSSYDEGYHYGRRPQRTRRYDEYGDSEDDISDHDTRRPSRAKTRRRLSRGRQTKSAGASRSRRDRSRSRSESREWHEEMAREKKNQAIRSALTAGAMEAMRQRNRPGDWLGTKGVRVATAAMSAAAIDTAVDRNPRKSGKTKMVTSALGGLFVDKLASSVRGRH